MAKAKVKENSFFTGMESFEEPTEVNDTAETVEEKEDAATAAAKESEPKPVTAQDPMPRKKRERKTVRVPLLVTPTVAAGMKLIAAREDRSVNDIENELMKAYVEKNL